MTWISAAIALLGVTLIATLFPLIRSPYDWRKLPKSTLRTRVGAALLGVLLLGVSGLLNQGWNWISLASLTLTLIMSLLILRRIQQVDDDAHPEEVRGDPFDAPSETATGWVENTGGHTTVHALLYPLAPKNHLQVVEARAIATGPEDVIDPDELSINVASIGDDQFIVTLSSSHRSCAISVDNPDWVPAARRHGLITLWIGSEVALPDLAGQDLTDYLTRARANRQLTGCLVALQES